MTRTFLAIELTDAARAALAHAVARLAHDFPMIRWSDPATIHLTLAFLGELDDARLGDAIAAADDAASSAAPFRLSIASISSFGSVAAPRVIWAGVHGDVPRLMALQVSLASTLAARGFPREARPFAPHLTLARLKGLLDGAVLRQLSALPLPTSSTASWPVHALSVMRSELRQDGARYTRLYTAPLRGSGPWGSVPPPRRS